jgi:hypothetical protein
MRAFSVQKKVSENTVLCIKHNFQLKPVCSIHSVALLNITLFKSKKFFIATHPSYLSGPMDTQKKSRYSSPVDRRSLDDLWPQIIRWPICGHRLLDDLCTSTYTSQKLCALSVLQKECRKVWGARYRLENTVIWNWRHTSIRHDGTIFSRPVDLVLWLHNYSHALLNDGDTFW